MKAMEIAKVIKCILVFGIATLQVAGQPDEIAGSIEILGHRPSAY